MNGRRKFLRDFLAVLYAGGATWGIFKILPSKALGKESPREW